ncbi:hypothetical protein GQ53DRAFT_766595 [Thozetella sp. PMI_491]|nr:hypothetical protein GQ53DRAFT_766595 [Thozetella sp. PMI_491]
MTVLVAVAGTGGRERPAGYKNSEPQGAAVGYYVDHCSPTHQLGRETGTVVKARNPPANHVPGLSGLAGSFVRQPKELQTPSAASSSIIEKAFARLGRRATAWALTKLHSEPRRQPRGPPQPAATPSQQVYTGANSAYARVVTFVVGQVPTSWLFQIGAGAIFGPAGATDRRRRWNRVVPPAPVTISLQGRQRVRDIKTISPNPEAGLCSRKNHGLSSLANMKNFMLSPPVLSFAEERCP